MSQSATFLTNLRYIRRTDESGSADRSRWYSRISGQERPVAPTGGDASTWAGLRLATPPRRGCITNGDAYGQKKTERLPDDPFLRDNDVFLNYFALITVN